MEPEEGRFEFAWLDEAITILGRHGISAILGTLTASMSAWGARKNNCFTSGAYRLLSERITRAMASHFASASNVIGWQTDNELGGAVCYCSTCRAEFQDWLRARYGRLDELSRRWGTHFSCQRYGTWGEIQLPQDPNGNRQYTGYGYLSTHNPSLCLDFQRYLSWLNVRFQGEQVCIIRELCPNHFITHNFMGLYSDLDYYDLAADLDQVSWDNYPVWSKPEIGYSPAAAAAVMRGLKRRSFWITEQTAKEFHQLAAEVEGTTIKAEVGIIYDYENIRALRIQPAFAGNGYHAAMMRYLSALFRAGLNVDMIKPTGDLSQYRLVIAPDFTLVPEAAAARIAEYIRKGGVFITDCRFGVKEETNLCYDRTLPGPLTDALGIAIEEYEAIDDGMEYRVVGRKAISGSFNAAQYAEWVTPQSAEALTGYDQWYLSTFAAVTRNQFGRGSAYYVGCVVKEPGFYDQLIGEALRAAEVEALLPPPAGVEVSVR